MIRVRASGRPINRHRLALGGRTLMTTYTRAGRRCRAQHLIRTVKGQLPMGAEGTVMYELDSFGRTLIMVNWDNGFAVPVFQGEIECDDQHSAFHSS
jgi:hypothetical protein